ncbi:pyridoxal-phosphate dependent enzyme [Aureibaculum sp. 2210JD6-5]|uniref:pyridoxal-phosphate dependent enzyme n=1 Tax=Aureibaculum sp. 2210JD6-5 TaxID=3103957 RepID=UPI002AADDFC6|nr:pyridoxal-phosphate dependent enzyme [Aureibaculum sp. 2210JD6-5]MDY7394432.1 pyridoxal-phosphate dependent enzyme [Aureibaculum sp. 2210JD6-5]
MEIKEDILESYNRILPYIHNTPIITSKTIDKMAGAELYFKCENFQKMGAFKMRGATNAILQLSPEQKQKGVVTHSSGNFAQALALAAKNLGVKSYIVMPGNAPEVKKSAVRGYGGEITECEPTLEARETTASKIQQEKGATFVHPFNDFNVVLGNASAGKELLEKHPDLDFIISPVGGGGLVSGTVLSAMAFGNNCKVIGAEPFAVDDAYRSMESGKIEHNSTTDTIGDGLKTSLGDITFNLINNHVEKIIRVIEEEIVAAMRLIWERMKIIVEPSSAVALAAVLNSKSEFTNKKVGVILSGGNFDLKKLPF